MWMQFVHMHRSVHPFLLLSMPTAIIYLYLVWVEIATTGVLVPTTLVKAALPQTLLESLL
jgi:hypothetical protein